jgi:hypothetical protein
MTDTMTPFLTTTYDTGGVAKASPEVTVPPERARTTEALAAFAGGQDNAPFLADFTSAVLTHAQCGRHLFRSVAGRTRNPMLQRRYQKFAEQAERTIVRLQQLVAELGGEPGYVSPSARATEKLDQGALEATFILDGSLDILTRELAMLDAVVIAFTVDDSNWQLLAEIADGLDGAPRDTVRAVVETVQPDVTANHAWAIQTRKRIVLMQAKHPVMAGVQATAEAALDWFKGLLADDDTGTS